MPVQPQIHLLQMQPKETDKGLHRSSSFEIITQSDSGINHVHQTFI